MRKMKYQQTLVEVTAIESMSVLMTSGDTRPKITIPNNLYTPSGATAS